MLRIALPALTLLVASPALAHPGAHLHPHDGASWLGVVMALGLMTAAGALVLTRRWAIAKARR